MPGAAGVIGDPAIDRLVVTDTVPPFRLDASARLDKIDTLHAAPLLAETVRRLHQGQALTDLMVV
jgi:ribose-phosphate pyrophosphokinase